METMCAISSEHAVGIAVTVGFVVVALLTNLYGLFLDHTAVLVAVEGAKASDPVISDCLPDSKWKAIGFVCGTYRKKSSISNGSKFFNVSESARKR